MVSRFIKVQIRRERINRRRQERRKEGNMNRMGLCYELW